MVKPDGVQRGLVGEIIKRFEQKGYQLVAMKLASPGKEHMEKHYEDLKEKKFFPGLISYMTSGPVVAMVWEVRNENVDKCVLSRAALVQARESPA
jgi:nucleoside-diphosphate kinase